MPSSEQAQVEIETESYNELSSVDRVNLYLSRSWVGRYFECEKRNTTFFQELRAGLVCFLTVCYIIPVNASILAETGGSCDPEIECTPEAWEIQGPSCRFNDDPGFRQCVSQFKDDLIASTCIASMLATFVMAVFARMPLAVAPSMGVNAYFTYNVVGYMGTKRVAYKQALAAVFVEGWIFILLSISGVRSRVVELIPKHIMYATAAGIGCFLAFVGLQQSQGIGFIVDDPDTLVALGGCPLESRAYSYSPNPESFNWTNVCNGTQELWDRGFPPTQSHQLGPRSPNYMCRTGQLRSATTWFGILGGMLMVLLLMKGTKASILIGILFITFISWIPGHKASYLGESSPIPGGEERKAYFRKGATVPTVSRTAGQLSFDALRQGDVWVALITFLYLDFLDATSTMFAMARIVAEAVPGFVNEKGKWPRQLITMLCDGVGIVLGSVMGSSPLSVFPESAVGIREGGHTGITSFVVACGFGISMFLSPIFASIPPFATGPAIVLVGSLMMEHSRYVHWDDVRQAVPAFLTIILMPLTYSIAYGIICGICTSIFLWLSDTVWEALLVLSGYYDGEKTLYHVWLDAMSNVYISANREDVLIRDLPGYKGVEVLPFEADSHNVDDPHVQDIEGRPRRSTLDGETGNGPISYLRASMQRMSFQRRSSAGTPPTTSPRRSLDGPSSQAQAQLRPSRSPSPPRPPQGS